MVSDPALPPAPDRGRHGSKADPTARKAEPLISGLQTGNRKTGISTPNSSEQFFDTGFLDPVSPVPVFLEEGSDDESVGHPEIRNVARIDPGTDENRNPVVGRIAVSVTDGIKDLQSFNCKSRL